jgi:hypothetical protein
MKKKFKNQHRTLESFGNEFLVVCPICNKQATVRSLGDRFPFIQNVTKRFLCTHCGAAKDMIPKQKHRQNVVCYGTVFQEGAICIGGAFDWYFGYPLYLQSSCCGKTLWFYNHEHLNYVKAYVEAELRDNYPYYRSVESTLPKWIKAAMNRETISKTIAKLEQM